MLRLFVYLLAALGFGALVLLTLPRFVIVLNDDFGYLRSILHTLRHGRPWTDDWLEPWAASLSWLAAKIAAATGSIKLATQGVQAACAAVAFLATCLLLARRGFAWFVCPVLAAIGLTFPTVLFKTVEFGALTLALPCLLLCLWLAEKRRWIEFFLVWLVAVTTRQSAIAWLALPGIAAILAWLGTLPGGARSVILPAAVCIAGVAGYGWIGSAMNQTHAQVVMTGGMWERLSPANARQALLLAAATFFLAAGIGGFFARTLLGGQPVARFSLRFPGIALRVFAAGVVICFYAAYAVDPIATVRVEHTLLTEENGRVYMGALCALSAIGWMLGGFRLRAELVLPALASAALVGLRHPVYDYYLLDVAIMAFFAAWPAERRQEAWIPATSLDVQRARPDAILGGVAAAVALAWFHQGFVTEMRRILDDQAARITLSEHALRAGLIEPSDLTATPFGHAAWHLYPYFVRMRGGQRESIGELANYFGWGPMDVRQSDEPLAPGAVVGGCTLAGSRGEVIVAQGWFPAGWGKIAKVTLERTPWGKPAAWPIDKSRYRLDPFPLNRAEWLEVLRKR